MQTNDLYIAVINSDERGITRAVDSIYPVLVNYLKTTHGACHDDGLECAQLAIIHTIEKIREDSIREPEKLKSYLLRSVRHHYARQRLRGRAVVFDEAAEYSVDPMAQSDFLIDAERRRILQTCLEKLDRKNREFMELWLGNPGIRAEEVALIYNSSVNAVWQRKFRLVKILQKCARQKER